MLKITNTKNGKKELFEPLNNKAVNMYVCGVTPYDASHIGHGRCYVTFDVLYRLLMFDEYAVTYCRNFTDIDDKLLNKAEKESGDREQYRVIATRYIDQFHDNMRSLNCLSPNHEPRVTDNIEAIISFIQELIDKGKAYQSNGDVYFRIKAFPPYGELSKHKLEDLRSGARVQVNEKKEDPLDFALWKSEPEGTFWQSPWGWGRPGWHIECSALAHKYLGEQIDIHGGGLDLVFPHHENEKAQTEALTEKPFATYWMHNGLVQLDKEKMSKSLGNFFTLNEIFAQHDPMIVRYLFLTHHYRAPLDFSLSSLAVAQKSYNRLARLLGQHTCPKKYTRDELLASPVVHSMVAFLHDDMNTPGLFGVVFEHSDLLQQDIEQACKVKQVLQDVLGLAMEPLPEPTVEVTPEIERLVAERDKARAEKDWARADALRDQLKALGVSVHDKKTD